MISRRWFQFRLGSLFVLVTFVAVCFAVGPQLNTYWNVRAISNGDVKVDGSWVGLLVSINTKAAKRVLSRGPSANPHLLAALQDSNRFAAAHVLLTEINEKSFRMDGGEWNHMRVTLRGDGRVDFHPEQTNDLIKYWTARLSLDRARQME